MEARKGPWMRCWPLHEILTEGKNGSFVRMRKEGGTTREKLSSVQLRTSLILFALSQDLHL